MKKEYHYKVKYSFLKKKANNDYARAKIEDFGFVLYVPKEDEDSSLYYAKTIKVTPDCHIGKWMKEQLELIYQKGGETWANELLQQGFVFDENEKLVMNDAFNDSLVAQLCISLNNYDYDHGCLFLNVEGYEFAGCDVVKECAPDDVKRLLDAEAIYRKKFSVRKK